MQNSIHLFNSSIHALRDEEYLPHDNNNEDDGGYNVATATLFYTIFTLLDEYVFKKIMCLDDAMLDEVLHNLYHSYNKRNESEMLLTNLKSLAEDHGLVIGSTDRWKGLEIFWCLKLILSRIEDAYETVISRDSIIDYVFADLSNSFTGTITSLASFGVLSLKWRGKGYSYGPNYKDWANGDTNNLVPYTEYRFYHIIKWELDNATNLPIAFNDTLQYIMQEQREKIQSTLSIICALGIIDCNATSIRGGPLLPFLSSPTRIPLCFVESSDECAKIEIPVGSKCWSCDTLLEAIVYSKDNDIDVSNNVGNGKRSTETQSLSGFSIASPSQSNNNISNSPPSLKGPPELIPGIQFNDKREMAFNSMTNAESIKQASKAAGSRDLSENEDYFNAAASESLGGGSGSNMDDESNGDSDDDDCDKGDERGDTVEEFDPILNRNNGDMMCDDTMNRLARVPSIESYKYFKCTLVIEGKQHIEFKPIPMEEIFTRTVPSNYLIGKIHIAMLEGEINQLMFTPTFKKKGDFINSIFFGDDEKDDPNVIPAHIRFAHSHSYCLSPPNQHSNAKYTGASARHNWGVIWKGHCPMVKPRLESYNEKPNSVKCTTKWEAGITWNELKKFGQGVSSDIVIECRFPEGRCLHAKNNFIKWLRGSARRREKEAVSVIYSYLLLLNTFLSTNIAFFE